MEMGEGTKRGRGGIRNCSSLKPTNINQANRLSREMYIILWRRWEDKKGERRDRSKADPGEQDRSCGNQLSCDMSRRCACG